MTTSAPTLTVITSTCIAEKCFMIPCQGRAWGLFWAIESNPKNPLLMTTAANASIHTVS
jgi:hypothetical protein